MRRKQVVHDDKVNFASVGYLYAVKAIKLRKKSVWVLLYVVVVVLQDLSEEFVFGMVDRLDDVLIVPGEIEETATLAWRAELRQDVLAC